LSQACTRELLDHEIDKLLEARNKSIFGKRVTRKQLVASYPRVIRKHTMKQVNTVTAVQVKKLFQGYPDSWPTLEVRCDLHRFREAMEHPEFGTSYV
jgi:hypothetical protein